MNASLQGLKYANETAAQYRRISPRQSAAMLLCAGNGTSLLFLSSLAGGLSGIRGWLLPAVGGIGSLLCALLISAAYRKTGAKTAEELFSSAFGRFGTAACTLFRLYSLLRGAFSVGVFSCFVKGLLFPETPFWILSLFMTAAVCAVIRGDSLAIARLSELSVLFLGIVLLSLLTCLPLADISRLRTAQAFSAPRSVLLPLILFCASGPELLLWHAPRLAPKKAAACLLLSVLARLGVFFFVLSVFGSAAIAAYPWPLITMFRGGELLLLERPELLLLIAFTMIALSPAVLFSASALPRDGKKPSSGLLLLSGALLFSASFLTDSAEKIPNAAGRIGMLFLFFGLFVPLALLVFGRKHNEKSGLS